MGTYICLQLSFITPPSPPLPSPLRLTNPFPSAYNHQLHWKNSHNTSSTTGPIRINLEDELYSADPDDDDGFGFGGSAKQRVWWSNDNDDIWFDDEDDMENEFWVFKVIRAFGWMIPAIGISLLLGTGPNPFLMALAVPLGQTALSLVIDKVWGSASTRTKPRRRDRTWTKKKPFVRPDNTEETWKRNGGNETRKQNWSYQSWMAADAASRKARKKADRFRGWDELEDLHKVTKEKPRTKANEPPKQQTKRKLSRARIVRDRPLFLRLLIAVFPFFGSWTKFLF